MVERKSLRKDKCQRTRDQVDLARNHGQNHVPDPDQRTVNVAGLTRNHGQSHGPDPDPVKGKETTHDCSHRLFHPKTKQSHGQKKRGDTRLDPAQEREEKRKVHHPTVLRELPAPVFCLLTTQSPGTGKRTRMLSED